MADFPDSITLPEISRPIVEAEIELLIALLDTLDPDPDLESTGDEKPWLGAPAGIQINGFGTNWQGWSAGDDREDDGDDLEPDCEDGRAGIHSSQPPTTAFPDDPVILDDGHWSATQNMRLM